MKFQLNNHKTPLSSSILLFDGFFFPKTGSTFKTFSLFFLFCTFTDISLSPFRGTLCVRLIVRNCMRDLRISRRRFFFFTMSYLRAKQLSNRARTGSPSLSSSHRVLSIRRWNFVKTTTLDQKNLFRRPSVVPLKKHSLAFFANTSQCKKMTVCCNAETVLTQQPTATPERGDEARDATQVTDARGAVLTLCDVCR